VGIVTKISGVPGHLSDCPVQWQSLPFVRVRARRYGLHPFKGRRAIMKPFTTIAALILLIVAGVHAWRLYSGAIEIVVAGHVIPVWASWPGAIIAGFMGIMLLVEARR
jgi:hypothetical protein